MHAVFCTLDPITAGLYALGKGLRRPDRDSHFAIFRQRLIIVGDDELRPGYVYTCDIPDELIVRGDNPNDVAVQERITPLAYRVVTPDEHRERIQRVENSAAVYAALRDLWQIPPLPGCGKNL